MDNQVEHEWLSIKDTARALGLSVKTIRRYIAKDKIPPDMVTMRDGQYGRQYYISVQYIPLYQQTDAAKKQEICPADESGFELYAYIQERDKHYMAVLQEMKDQLELLRQSTLKLEETNSKLMSEVKHAQEIHFREIDARLDRWWMEVSKIEKEKEQEQKRKNGFPFLKK